ncbi:VOC family protein [Neptunomonas japonica]|uniref:Glyoxalase n=1 Tax=Neptunomonas japonica JAMM 1380 TaxID=1441457 RepID=A0A7R6SXZ1_9GAMM|nr:VOC family protein [Neptunomonas japonica]BBB31187.1 glyoxalase [Neptunomonas japonica JAMM 1380]
MSKKVSPIPRGYRTVTPVIVVRGIQDAVEFYRGCFGAEPSQQVLSPDGLTVVAATLKIGNSFVRVMEESLENKILSPSALGGAAASLHLYINDIDTFWQQALDCGARPITALQDTYWGERHGIVVDPFGHHWSMASKIENLSKDELASRAKEAFAC